MWKLQVEQQAIARCLTFQFWTFYGAIFVINKSRDNVKLCAIFLQ